MLYEELSPQEKKSFQLSLTKTIDEYSQNNNYQIMNVDMDLVQNIVSEMKLKAEAGFQKWANREFEIPDEVMLQMIDAKVRKMRKRKPSSRQKEYFIGMRKSLEEDETIPEDNFQFRKELKELRERYQEIGPATESQVKGIKNSWKKVFGKELNLCSLTATRGTVQRLFNVISEYSKDILNAEVSNLRTEVMYTGSSEENDELFHMEWIDVNLKGFSFSIGDGGFIHLDEGECPICHYDINFSQDHEVCYDGEDIFFDSHVFQLFKEFYYTRKENA